MSKQLIAYFSAGGATKSKAEALAAAAGAPLYEIRPETPYTAADIKWTNPLARCNKEWIKKIKPALADHSAPVADADVIFLGFPIWYYTAPLIVKSFLEAYDFSGKTVVLFATSGGSDMKKCVATLSPSAPGAKIVAGKMMNGPQTEETLRAFAAQY